METILSGNLDEVFVGANAGSLESLIVPHKNNQPPYPKSLSPRTVWVLVTYLGGKLFIFVGDQVDTEGKLVDTGTLASQIEDPDLRVGNTTVEA